MAPRAKLLGLEALDRREGAGGGGGPVQESFSLEAGVEADREAEEWRREREGPHAGGGEGVHGGGPQVPEVDGVLPRPLLAGVRRHPGGLGAAPPLADPAWGARAFV